MDKEKSPTFENDNAKLLDAALRKNLKMSAEERIVAHENARKLMLELKKAGDEYRARPQNSSNPTH